MMSWMMNNGGMSLMGFMIVVMTIWILVLVVLIWALIHWLNGRVMAPPPGQGPLPGSPSAFEILKLRYARGEIDHATYEQMRERLQASTPTGFPTSSTPRS